MWKVPIPNLLRCNPEDAFHCKLLLGWKTFISPSIIIKRLCYFMCLWLCLSPLWGSHSIRIKAHLTCNKKSKRASLPHSEWWTPTQGADLRSASSPQWTCRSFWYWTHRSGSEFWSLSLSARCWISGSHHTTGLGTPLMYRYGRISLWNVLRTAGRLLLRPSTLSRWKANTSNQSSVRLMREQCPCWQRSLWVSGCLWPGPGWGTSFFSDVCWMWKYSYIILY